MNKKSILMVAALAIAVSGLGFFFSDAGSKRQTTPARDAVKNYLIDQNRYIRVEETSIAGELQLPHTLSAKGGITGDDTTKEDTINLAGDPEDAVAHDLTGDLPDHNLAEYFRYLQTQVGEGNSPDERTESIREHLLSTLPREKAGELIDLYEKFTDFEQDAVSKAKEWSMPESADETLSLIGDMQAYQQEYFGEDTADLLFGAEMKVMEYNARQAIIINDRFASGLEKEQLLDQLGIDMWGEAAYQEMNQNKDPYDILDEKLLIYGNDLAAADPATREEEIKKLRAKYLPKMESSVDHR